MDIEELKLKAKEIRKDIIEEVYYANSGHPGGSLSIADIMTVLYFKELNINEKAPRWEDRDRLILSKGHCSPALYAVLAERGFFDKEKLKSFRKLESNLQGHPERPRKAQRGSGICRDPARSRPLPTWRLPVL